MRPYRLNEADLQVPAEWKDTTIHAFVLPGEAVVSVQDGKLSLLLGDTGASDS